MSVTLLHVSDPHLTEDPASAQRLRHVLDLPPSRQPDAIVITGDIADHGQPQEYRAFTAAMTAAMTTEVPWIAIPGNHDHPDTLRTELQQDRCPTIDVGRLRVIGLDVTVPGKNHGFLNHNTAQLAVTQAQGAHHIALALHQPPVKTGHAIADTMLLTNPQALINLIQRIPPVVAILCGHAHTPLASSLAGTPVLGAPGIASALALDSDRRPMTMPNGPPGLALHRIDNDGAVTTTFHHGA